ncbi:unnamed protein product [Merluccius merluccius]
MVTAPDAFEFEYAREALCEARDNRPALAAHFGVIKVALFLQKAAKGKKANPAENGDAKTEPKGRGFDARCPRSWADPTIRVCILGIIFHDDREVNSMAIVTPWRPDLQPLQLSLLLGLHHHLLTTDMIIRLGRLTPGYFRLLQRQVAGEVQTQPHDRAVNQIAMMLAIMGLGLSYYSAKQMTEEVQNPPPP